MKNWIPAIILSLGLVYIVCFLTWFILFINEPDLRTTQQIQEDEYRKCIKYIELVYVEKCKDYLK